MNSPAQSVLTARFNRSEVSFAPGGDVIVGSDVRADLRVAHPLVTRAHLLLRFDHGRWVAVDNNWAQIFAKVGADPDEANRRFLARQDRTPPIRAETPADLGAPAPACFASSPRSPAVRFG
jgi:hypothetical protein